ncbi:hypothetical protein Pyrfu_1203 [Pyrolobus fumarii 1A]|uniref:Uncharacterized protein n=1 Tax=Pyrolobus fumarii (strain DSM 11204 / 1A) TaxID=694429 RepID=G0EFW4_PYRF1|nr:hypothetical protein [Pyrolobus fumarii]AEM39065.1 hypothetical protein Pyrfu_1203 [Pyrolobus fumarii 1A]
MTGAYTLDTLEEMVKSIWRQLTPDVDDAEKRILLYYLRAGAATPYKIARMAQLNVATVYRKAKKLLEKRVVVPVDGSRETLALSAKGCITLYVNNIIDVNMFAECMGRIWGLRATPEELLGFLYILGVEAQRRRLTLKNMTICKIDEASIHVLRLLKEAILAYLRDGASFTEVLDELAHRLGVPPGYLRSGIRLALRGITRTLPLSIHTEHHKVTLFMHDKLLFPFAIECKIQCQHFWDNLGFECPILMEELRGRLATITAQTACTPNQPLT